MTTHNAVAEAEIRERVDALVGAVRTGDLETLTTIFAPDVVSFDIQAPLRHLGATTKLDNWRQVFTFYRTPLDYELRDLTVLVDGDLAVVFSLNRMTAELVSGGKTDYWLRWTAAWQKVEGRWMIVHDQVSVPTYFQDGRAAMDLTP